VAERPGPPHARATPPGAALGADPGLGYAPATSPHRALRLTATQRDPLDVTLAEEVPVALAYNRRVHAVVMCTPCDLEEWAVGFTVSEGIADAGDVEGVEVARHSRGIDVSLTVPAAVADALAARQRAMSARTGCGICGVESIDAAVRPVRRVRRTFAVTPGALYAAGAALAGRQSLNRDTHAIHAAAWATPDGTLAVVREDVGRHNALDKALGALLGRGLDPSAGFLVLTSRASVELVQKAAACGVPLLAAVSRPTALAVRLAAEGGMTLVGLLRGEGAVVYAGALDGRGG
jgi:formate dehydrogenase accessory protein FdhD